MGEEVEGDCGIVGGVVGEGVEGDCEYVGNAVAMVVVLPGFPREKFGAKQGRVGGGVLHMTGSNKPQQK